MRVLEGEEGGMSRGADFRVDRYRWRWCGLWLGWLCLAGQVGWVLDR